MKEQGKEPPIEIALINEITGDHLKDIAADGAELTIDHFLAEGFFKEMPFFGILYKAVKATLSIRESLFAKKVFKFLVALKDVPQEEREKFIQKLEASREYRQKVGEKLIMILDSLDDMQKPEIVGRLLKAAINEDITYEEFLHLSSIVRKGFLPYLKRLADQGPRGFYGEEHEHFASLGIMSLKLKDEPAGNVFGLRNNDPIYNVDYYFNRTAAMLITYGLRAEIDAK